MKFITKIQQRKIKQHYYSKLRRKKMEYNYLQKYILLPKDVAKKFRKGSKVEVRIEKLANRKGG